MTYVLDNGIATRANADIKLYNRKGGHANPDLEMKPLRFYRSSPDTCVLQIRGENRYAHLSLTRDELFKLKEAIDRELPTLRDFDRSWPRAPYK